MSGMLYKSLEAISPDFYTTDVQTTPEFVAPFMFGHYAVSKIRQMTPFSTTCCRSTHQEHYKRLLLSSLLARPDKSVFIFDEDITRVVVKKLCGESRIRVSQSKWLKLSDVFAAFPRMDKETACLSIWRSVRGLIIDFQMCEDEMFRINEEHGFPEVNAVLLIALSFFNKLKMHERFLTHMINYEETMPANCSRFAHDSREAMEFQAPPFLLNVLFDFSKFERMLKARCDCDFASKPTVCANYYCLCEMNCSREMSYKQMKKRSERMKLQYHTNLKEAIAHLCAKHAEAVTECCVCLDSPAAVRFAPCGHSVCCEECASEISTCVLCRASIVGTSTFELVSIPLKDQLLDCNCRLLSKIAAADDVVAVPAKSSGAKPLTCC